MVKATYLGLVFFFRFLITDGLSRRLEMSSGGLRSWQTNNWNGQRQGRWTRRCKDGLGVSSGMVVPVGLEPSILTRFVLYWTNRGLDGVEYVGF
jgi:hypothetical protein